MTDTDTIISNSSPINENTAVSRLGTFFAMIRHEETNAIHFEILSNQETTLPPLTLNILGGIDTTFGEFLKEIAFMTSVKNRDDGEPKSCAGASRLRTSLTTMGEDLIYS